MSNEMETIMKIVGVEKEWQSKHKSTGELKSRKMGNEGEQLRLDVIYCSIPSNCDGELLKF
jgi:hypothetical protein